MINFRGFKFLLSGGIKFLMARKFLISLMILALLANFAYAADSETDPAKKVVARVASQDITELEVMMFLQPFGQQAMMLWGSEQGRKMIIDDVISMRLYSLEGESKKLDQTAEFKSALENTRRAMLAQSAMRDIIKDINVTDEEAKKFYDEHPDMFMQQERVHARHILVKPESEDAAVKIIADLKAGSSFDVLAKEYSIDPGSKINGGDLGEFPRGVMVPEFEEAAFALKNPGDISEPVKSQFGWHIIKLEEKIPESPSPFEQVKPQIVQELQNQKTQELLKDHAEELEKVYKVERF